MPHTLSCGNAETDKQSSTWENGKTTKIRQMHATLHHSLDVSSRPIWYSAAYCLFRFRLGLGHRVTCCVLVVTALPAATIREKQTTSTTTNKPNPKRKEIIPTNTGTKHLSKQICSNRHNIKKHEDKNKTSHHSETNSNNNNNNNTAKNKEASQTRAHVTKTRLCPSPPIAVRAIIQEDLVCLCELSHVFCFFVILSNSLFGLLGMSLSGNDFIHEFTDIGFHVINSWCS